MYIQTLDPLNNKACYDFVEKPIFMVRACACTCAQCFILMTMVIVLQAVPVVQLLHVCAESPNWKKKNGDC